LNTPIYTHYAPVYHAIGQAWVGLRAWAGVSHWLAARGWRGGSAVDLGCGSGELALALARGGYAVTGVDRSAAMLALAAEHGSGGHDVRWQQADIAAWTSPAPLDLAVCFYDTVNYLTAEGALAALCRNVAASLRPGGIWAFDINTPLEYESWVERSTVTADNERYFVYNVLHFDPDRARAEGRIVWFERQGDAWARGEEFHDQRPYSDAEIEAALRSAGLALQARLDLDGQPADPDTATRMVYVAARE
jgi:SAM-dependent methyltransferase